MKPIFTKKTALPTQSIFRTVRLGAAMLVLTAPAAARAESTEALIAEDRPDLPVLPFETRVEIRPGTPQGTLAKVTLIYPHNGFEVVDWGEVAREGNAFRVDIQAVSRSEHFVLPVLTSFSHVYELGHPEPGDYGFEVFSNGHPLKGKKFSINEDAPPPPFPADVRLRVKVADGAAMAEAAVQFTLPGYHMADWGEPMRRGSYFTISARAERHHDLLRAEELVHQSRHRYKLGQLSPGEYHLAFLINDRQMAETVFRVHPDGQGGVLLQADPLTEPGQTAHPITVIYRHPAGIDTNSLSDRNIRITGPNGYDRFARLVDWEILPTITILQPPVAARYEVLPRERTWTARDNGEYRVLLTQSVKSANGELFPREHLGNFRVDVPKQPRPLVKFGGLQLISRPGPEPAHYSAMLTLILPSSNVKILSWGEVKRVGNRFFVDVEIGGETDVGLPVTREESHVYELGTLRPGDYGFNVTSRGHHIGSERFTIEGHAVPTARVKAENLTERSPHPHLFQIAYRSANGMDVDSIRRAPILVRGPDGYFEHAELRNVEVFQTALGGEVVHATHAAPPPRGGWSAAANGFYAVLARPDTIFDQAGNALPGGRLGGFYVKIRPGEPDPERPWLAFATREENGMVFADLEFHPGDSGWRVTHWGQDTRLQGHTFLAKARIEEPPAADEPATDTSQRHTYRLGRLAPGLYRFVLHGSNGFVSRHAFVAGVGLLPPPPYDQWRSTVEALLEDDGDFGDALEEQHLLRSYAFGFDPREGGHGDAGRPKMQRTGGGDLTVTWPEVPTATDVAYRVEATDDLLNWVDITARLADRGLTELTDGTHRRTAGLPEDILGQSTAILRVRLIKTGEDNP